MGVVEKAAWHTAKKDLEVPEGIHLEYLPSHSPELRPSERLWPISNEGVANRYFDILEELTSPSLSDRTPVTTGGREWHDKQSYSNGPGIMLVIGALMLRRALGGRSGS